MTSRSELAMLRARYDHGAVSPGVYAAIRKLETDIAWQEHQREQSNNYLIHGTCVGVPPPSHDGGD